MADGHLELKEVLETYLPGFPNGDRITIEHLLSHSSGIPSDVYLDGFGDRIREESTLDDAVEWVRGEAEPRFEPGDRFDYSNSGFLLLTTVIETVSGKPFNVYLADRVFRPAGMTRSGLDSWEAILPGRAKGYSRTTRGRIANTPYRNPSFGWGYGALYSTVLDLWAFQRTLVAGGLIADGMKDEMWRPHLETPWGNEYGLGWFVDEVEGRGFVSAVGSTGGFAATIRHFLEEDLVVVVLLNHDFLLYERLFDQISKIALGMAWEPVLVSRGQHPGGDRPGDSRGAVPEGLHRMLGLFEMEDGTRLELRQSRDRLEFGYPGSGDFFEVIPLANQEGYVPAQNARLIFREGSEGETTLFALFGNFAWQGTRIPQP